MINIYRVDLDQVPGLGNVCTPSSVSADLWLPITFIGAVAASRRRYRGYGQRSGSGGADGRRDGVGVK
jgi:hypothetical protein